MEFSFDMNEMTQVMGVDFGDGAGPVPAHQHPKGGGWVAETAKVDPDCYVGPNAVVFGEASVYENAIINDGARVYGKAQVYGRAKVYGNAEVFDLAQVYDNAKVSGNSKVYQNARVVNNAMVHDNAQIYGNAIIRNNAEVFNNCKIYDNGDIYDSIKIYDDCEVTNKPKAIFGFDYTLVITDYHVTIGCVSFPPSMIESTGKKIFRLLKYPHALTDKYIGIIKSVAELHGCVDRPEDLESFNERKLIMDLLNAKVGVR